MSNINCEKGIPSTKVELHVHLDGAIRLDTLWDTMQKRDMTHIADSKEELRHKVTMDGIEGSLTKCLSTFTTFMPIVAGCADAIRRIAYEFCEDVSRHGVIYCEVRYSPHLFADSMESRDYSVPQGNLTPSRVVELVNDGLRQGSADFKITVNSILCCMWHRPEWSMEIVELCDKYRESGVVGIDIAGDELLSVFEQHIQAFEEAKRRGIKRTVHAGEAGPAKSVLHAIEVMHAQRIGHGYHVLDDNTIYDQVRVMDGIHFEVCPYSSVFLESVHPEPSQHASVRFAKDGVSFSISTDDPSVFGKTITDDYVYMLEKVQLTPKQLIKSNFDAAKASFLNVDQKEALLIKLEEAYGSRENYL